MWNEDQVTFESFKWSSTHLVPTNVVRILHNCCFSYFSEKSLQIFSEISVLRYILCVWSVALSTTLQPGTWQSATVSELWHKHGELERAPEVRVGEGRRGKLNKCLTSFHLFGFTFKLGNVQVSKCFNKRERKIVLERQFQTEHK